MNSDLVLYVCASAISHFRYLSKVFSFLRMQLYGSELSLAGVLGVLQHPWNLGVLFTLFQPEGADYAHHIAASTPGFENLTTSL